MDSNFWHEKFKPILSSLGKSFLWTCLTTFFGLFQIFIIILISSISTFTLPSEKIFSSCIFLFFSSSLVSSMCFDYYLGEVSINSKIIVMFLYFIAPVVIFLCCAIIFTYVFLNENSTKYEALKNIQLTFLVCVFLHAWVCKTHLYFSERR